MLIELIVVVMLAMYRKPLPSALIYGALSFIGLIFGASLGDVLIGAVIGFVIAFVFFWILERFEGGILWWILLIGGLAGWVYLRLLPAFS